MRSAGGNDRVRQVLLRTSGASVVNLAGGEILIRPVEALDPYPKVLTDRITHWAEVAPTRICVAQRDESGRWRQLTYTQVLAAARSIGQALLDRGLSSNRPPVILSENSIEHLLLMLAGQHVGIPTLIFHLCIRSFRATWRNYVIASAF
jgi:feruloyl-CoA synthase